MHQPTLQELGEALTRATPHRTTHASNRSSRFRASVALILSDAITLIAVLVGVVALRTMNTPQPFPFESYLIVGAAIVFGNAFASSWRGIYPGYGICAIAEMRSTFYTVTGVFAAVIAISFFTRGMMPYARSILLMAWFFSVPMLELSRLATRKWLSRKPWFGIPTIIIGQHSMATRIVDTLRNHVQIGLRPLAIVEPDSETAEYGYHDGVPVIGGLEHVGPLTKRYGLTHGIVAMPHTNSDELNAILEDHCSDLSHVTFVGDHVHPSVIWISNANSDVLLSAEIEQRLRQPELRLKKRLFDILVTIPLLLVSLPLMLVIALAIKLTSRGPVLYRQQRVGERGHMFSVLKFRTMVTNADEVLQDLLDSDPSQAEEWARYHKLKSDPRITGIGHWLRKYSLDELPQLWNVLIGEMTLVGSRPFLAGEMAAFDFERRRAYLSMYHSTKPGLTGLWQVTVRNDAEFDVRTHVDLYYMRNWSLFLDIYILLRTVGVVMTGRGAY